MSLPADILIRALEPGDVADLHEAMGQPRVVWGTLQEPYVSQAARAQRLGVAEPGVKLLVAVIDGKVIGSASLHRQERHRRSHVGDIGLSVHDGYTGRGAGSALMAALLDVGDNWWNLKRIELQVFADNAAAIRLYERFGFRREGLMRAYAWRDGAYVDSVSMARLRL